MVQKDVEDIFSKTMGKKEFRQSNTMRLAKTFIAQKKKSDSRKEKVLKQHTQITEEIS